jgi:hypothetical protein
MSLDKPCPYCLWPMKAGEQLIECPECDARLHDECWTDNGGCATFGCPAWMQAQQAAAEARAAQLAAGGTAAPAPPAAVATREPTAAPVLNFCDQCGARAEGPVTFCASCGTRFES